MPDHPSDQKPGSSSSSSERRYDPLRSSGMWRAGVKCDGRAAGSRRGWRDPHARILLQGHKTNSAGILGSGPVKVPQRPSPPGESKTPAMFTHGNTPRTNTHGSL